MRGRHHERGGRRCRRHRARSRARRRGHLGRGGEGTRADQGADSRRRVRRRLPAGQLGMDWRAVRRRARARLCHAAGGARIACRYGSGPARDGRVAVRGAIGGHARRLAQQREARVDDRRRCLRRVLRDRRAVPACERAGRGIGGACRSRRGHAGGLSRDAAQPRVRRGLRAGQVARLLIGLPWATAVEACAGVPDGRCDSGGRMRAPRRHRRRRRPAAAVQHMICCVGEHPRARSRPRRGRHERPRPGPMHDRRRRSRPRSMLGRRRGAGRGSGPHRRAGPRRGVPLHRACRHGRRLPRIGRMLARRGCRLAPAARAARRVPR